MAHLEYRKRFEGNLVGSWKRKAAKYWAEDFISSPTHFENWTIEVRWAE